MNRTRESANLVTENNIFVNTTTNRVGLGSTVPVSKLDVSGDVTADNFNSTSDKSMKTNINIIENPLEGIRKVEGVSFTWKDSGKNSYGVIAQNIAETYPELVDDNGSHLTVNYNGLVGVLIEAIKDQQKQIDILVERVKDIEDKKFN